MHLPPCCLGRGSNRKRKLIGAAAIMYWLSTNETRVLKFSLRLLPRFVGPTIHFIPIYVLILQFMLPPKS